MTHRRVAFHAFCSIKGGVGKSTLAVALAKLIAERGGVPVLIDVDLTGSSLADGLCLCAPVVALRDDGSMALEASPTGEHMSRSDTLRTRNERKASLRPDVPPPYFNDALLYEVRDPDHDCRLDAMLWSHAHPDGVHYLPSSSLRHDVEASVTWIHGDEPFQWIRRVAWLVDALLAQRPDVTDIVLDLPAGTVGLAHEALVFLATLAPDSTLPEGYPDWSAAGIGTAAYAFLVTTPDWSDILPALEYTASSSVQQPALPLRPVVNRIAAADMSDLQDEVRKRLDPGIRPLGMEQRLIPAYELPGSLGQLFRRGDLPLDEDVRRIAGSLLIKESP